MQLFKHLFWYSSFSITLLFPVVVVNAQAETELAKDFVERINQAILYPLIMLMMGVALLYFLYGAFEFIIRADNENDRQTGKKHLLWGLVGLLVMVSAYAILEIAANTFDVSRELQDARI